MSRPSRLGPFGLLCLLTLGLAPVAGAQRRVIGAEADDEAPTDAGPPPADAAPPADKKGKKKADTKKGGEEKAEAPADAAKQGDAPKAPAPDAAKKPDATKTPPKRVNDGRDVLVDTDKEKRDREAAEKARLAAEAAAEKAAVDAKLKEEEQKKKLVEEKRAAEERRKIESRDQRLVAAKKKRQLVRRAGNLVATFSLVPGQVKTNALVELRIELNEALEVADPRFGKLKPMPGVDLVASVQAPTGKKAEPALRYAVHPLEAPGAYGVHFTPAHDGPLSITFSGSIAQKSSADEGNTDEGAARTFEVTVPVHVGVWPPPDFDDEERQLSAGPAQGGT